MTAVRFNNVSIVFGKGTDRALAMIDAGKSRDEISAETGLVLGVSNASLDVQEGEILVLMGLSGSGKSTLLRAVNALAPVTRGEVQVRSKGAVVNPYQCRQEELYDLRMHTVSMVFQQFGLLNWRTVAENVGFGLELAGVPHEARCKTVEAQLDLVNLSSWRDRKLHELSGGMQQRVGLARALATGAPILLMDEPFSALDPLIRTKLQDELLELQRTLKKTILFVSHDLEEAFKIGNRIAIMESGRIVQCGTPREIVKNPASQYVTDFVQHLNPLNFLTAFDVMRRDSLAPGESTPALVPASEKLSAVMALLAQHNGPVGVTVSGTVVGAITAQDVVDGLTRHRR